MAVETKVGLVVGLAFIVCFGVILSNRGSGERISTDVALELLNRHRQSGVDETKIAGQGYLRRNVSRSGQTEPLRRRETRVEPAPIIAEAVPARRESAPIVSRPEQMPIAAEASPSNEAGPLSYESLFGGESAVQTPAPKTEPVIRPQRRQQAPVRTVPQLPPHRQPVAQDVYVVKSGDTLWRIASAVYGRATLDVVNAIHAANRDRMSSANQIKVGMRLVMPALEGEAKQVVAAAVPSSGGPWTYYQVRSGDRYALIAEELLGDKGRWQELYELNKDIFPDAGRIRPGVRIRVPARTLALAN